MRQCTGGGWTTNDDRCMLTEITPVILPPFIHGQNAIFQDRADDHKDDLLEDDTDAVLKLLAPFL